MRILLVDDQERLVASLENVERYDTRNPTHFAGLLDLLESLAAAGHSHAAQAAPAVTSGPAARRRADESGAGRPEWILPNIAANYTEL